jgi:outer membrane immunogenic protein
MKKLFSISALAAAAAFGFAGSANAADMPVKAAPPPVPVAYDWSGLYVGFHEGYQWGDVHEVQTPPAGGFTEDSTLSVPIAGFHVGIQKEFLNSLFGWNWLLGVEGSLNEPLKRNDRGNFAPCANPAFVCGLSNITEDWTVGGRLGVAFSLPQMPLWLGGDYLFTVSGGYVSAMFKRADVNANGSFCSGGACTQAWHNGAYVGAGLEHVLAKGNLVDWITGIDYQHQFFDGQTDVEILGAVNHNIQADVDMIRLRTTLKFK